MDTPPRLPSCARRGLQQGIEGVATTNEAPERGMDESEETRLTPPLEIFVRELSFSGLLNDQSSSALTEVTFDNSGTWSLQYGRTSGSSARLSTASSVSSVDNEESHAMIASGDEDENRQSLRRLPARGQSSRRPRVRRGGKKGVMRWASMPHKPPSTGDCHKSPGAAKCPPTCGCDGHVKPKQSQSPRLPRRQGSNPSLDDSSLANGSVNDENDNYANSTWSSDHHSHPHEHNSTGRRDRPGACRKREKPRLPTRKKSDGSLFGGSVASTDSSTGTDEVILPAHAA